jgi:hypothetical protein
LQAEAAWLVPRTHPTLHDPVSRHIAVRYDASPVDPSLTRVVVVVVVVVVVIAAD